jgi:hypothetical protein
VLALVYHPDKSTGDEEKFKQIQRAYELLTNENELEKEMENRLDNFLERESMEKINKVKKFLSENDIPFEEGHNLEYYDDMIRIAYQRIMYMFNYHWKVNPYRRIVLLKLNQFVLNELGLLIEKTKRDIQFLRMVNYYDLDLNRLSQLVFLIFIIEEKLYDPKYDLDNDVLVDLLNLLEYGLEHYPIWEILQGK